MLTAGSGITPVMSMIRTLVPSRPDANVVLIHSSRGQGDSIFREELAELADQFPNFRLVQWHTEGRGRMNFTSTAVLEEVCPDWRARAAYACGPESFLDDAEAMWNQSALAGAAASANESKGVKEVGSLTIERFSTELRGGDGGEGGIVTFEASDREVLAGGNVSILDVGEDAGLLMPSGCRMGICHSCLTPLLAGRVRDLRTGEVRGAPGELIQTCVSAAAGPVNLGI